LVKNNFGIVEHSCVLTGIATLVYKDENPGLGTLILKQELGNEQTIPPQITLPSWGLAFLLGSPSPSLAFGWDVLYWISPYGRDYKSRPA